MFELGGFELGRVHCVDCLEALKQLPDKCVDLVLTDPPYGIGEATGKNKSRGRLAKSQDYGNKEWDNRRVDCFCADALRVGANTVINERKKLNLAHCGALYAKCV